MNNGPPNRFANLTYEDFRRFAKDTTMSQYERIGFPDSYRKGKEGDILRDIRQKLPALDNTNKIIVDIGPGCSDLPRMLMEHCGFQKHCLYLIDSKEMLDLLPDHDVVTKVAARFPECAEICDALARKVDVILSYSVLQYALEGISFWRFLDSAVALLADGGRFLIGDLPNVSKRKRFFASNSGRSFHMNFTGSNELPDVQFNSLEPGQIDDAVVLAILSRYRAAGYDTYILPQLESAPMSNRREDILICKP